MCRHYKSKKIIQNIQWSLKTQYEDSEEINSNMGQRSKQTTQQRLSTDFK